MIRPGAQAAAQLPLVAVVGMRGEARIIERKGIITVVGGGDSLALAAKLSAVLAGGVSGVISFGLCGALDPTLAVGDLVVATSVAMPEGPMPCALEWSYRIIGVLDTARLGGIAAVDAPVASAAAKGELRARTGAIAVDMESHIAARLAAVADLPFTALRAVSDGADRTLPRAAQVGLAANGSPDISAVLRSLAADPRQLPALLRTAREAGTAMAALLRGYDLLARVWPSGSDLGQTLLDVA